MTNITPIEKTLLSLSALVTSARKGLETHSEPEIAAWLQDRLENEANTLDYELNEGEYSEGKND